MAASLVLAGCGTSQASQVPPPTTAATAAVCTSASIGTSTGRAMVGTVECSHGWALGGVSGTEGQTLFRSADGAHWKVVTALGDSSSVCTLAASGVPASDAAAILTALGAPSWRLTCMSGATTTTAAPSATTTTTTSVPAPTGQPGAVLGSASWAAGLPGGGVGVVGFGAVAPASINEGGNDPAAGYVHSITWGGWGAPQATGQGTAVYVTDPSAPVSAQPDVAVTVVAFNLSTCDGSTPAYTSVSWYFPEYGQSFDPAHAFNACTGSSS